MLISLFNVRHHYGDALLAMHRTQEYKQQILMVADTALLLCLRLGPVCGGEIKAGLLLQPTAVECGRVN